MAWRGMEECTQIHQWHNARRLNSALNKASVRQPTSSTSAYNALGLPPSIRPTLTGGHGDTAVPLTCGLLLPTLTFTIQPAPASLQPPRLTPNSLHDPPPCTSTAACLCISCCPPPHGDSLPRVPTTHPSMAASVQLRASPPHSPLVMMHMHACMRGCMRLNNIATLNGHAVEHVCGVAGFVTRPASLVWESS